MIPGITSRFLGKFIIIYSTDPNHIMYDDACTRKKHPRDLVAALFPKHKSEARTCKTTTTNSFESLQPSKRTLISFVYCILRLNVLFFVLYFIPTNNLSLSTWVRMETFCCFCTSINYLSIEATTIEIRTKDPKQRRQWPHQE